MNPGARRATPSMNPISMSRSRSCSRVSFFDRFGGMSNVTTADDYTQNGFKSSDRPGANLHFEEAKSPGNKLQLPNSKHQVPNTKLQTPEKLQLLNSKHQRSTRSQTPNTKLQTP